MTKHKRLHYSPRAFGILLIFAAILILAELKIRLQSSDKIISSLVRKNSSRTKKPFFLFNESPTRLAFLLKTLELRLFGSSHCIRYALALSWLCQFLGLGSAIHIGVRRGRDNLLEAHTWIESPSLAFQDLTAEKFQPLQRPDPS